MPINLNFSTDSILAMKSQLEGLRKAIADASDPVEINRLTRQFDTLNTAIDETNTEIYNLGGTFEDVYGESVRPLNTQLGEMEDRMYALAFAGQSGTAEFEALRAETVRMRQTIIAVDESVDDLANNRGIASFGSQIGEVGASLLTLDFTRANTQAQGLARTAASINFGDAIGQVKQLGSTFINLGKALLTNPLFLIVGAVVAIGVAIVKLLDKLGLLKVIMDAVGQAFEWVGDLIDSMIQPLKDLTDALGWTNNAATKLAEESVTNTQKMADAQDKSSKKVIQSLDNELRILKTKGDVNDADFERILEIEREKRVQLQLTAKARYEEAQAAYDAAVLKGDLDADELKALKDKAYEMRMAADQAREEITIGDIEADASRKKRKETQAKEDKDLLDKQTADAKATYEKRLADEAAYEQQRLATKRLIQDIETSAIADDTERALEENRLKYERLREDTLSNTKLTADEKARLQDLYNQQELMKSAEINQKVADEKAKIDAEELQKQIEREDAQFALLQEIKNTKKEQEIADLVADYEEKYLLAVGNAELERALKEEQELAIAEIEDRYREEQEAKEEEARQKKLDADKQLMMATLDATKSGLQGISDLVGAFAGKSRAAQKKAFETQKKLNIVMATIDTIKGAVSAFTGMTSSIPGPVGLVLGAVAAAGVVASGVANIKKISSTKFEGGGGTGGAASVNTGGSVAAAATPSLSTAGQESDLNNVSQAQSAEANQQQQPIQVQATVSETEITSTQNRVRQYEQNAEL